MQHPSKLINNLPLMGFRAYQPLRQGVRSIDEDSKLKRQIDDTLAEEEQQQRSERKMKKIATELERR